MLDHELSVVVQAERERAIREARLYRDIPRRPSRVVTLVRALVHRLRPDRTPRQTTGPGRVARDLGAVAGAVSARPASADRQRAC